MATFEVATVSNRNLAMTNMVYLNPEDYKAVLRSESTPAYLQIREFVFSVGKEATTVKGSIALSALHRQLLSLAFSDKVPVKPFKIEEHSNIYLSDLELEINFFKKSTSTHTFDCDKLGVSIQNYFDLQIFCLEQRFLYEFDGFILVFRVVNYNSVDISSLKEGVKVTSNAPRGLLTKKTKISFVKAPNTTFRLKGGVSKGTNPIRPDWNFESMGIGGLDAEFSEIFRRAFASRVFPASVVKEFGVSFIKGMLLYGPPGTGKTLLARQIGKMLNAREPKIVNGPEVFNKYVGQTEENIRNLFIDAEKEYAERGDESDLHIIIFDEIDAICKTRGSVQSGTGVHDTVVNQLLTKIDGVNSLNNILVIGMTNRKDMIDEALLRPGRLEVHVEIGLPDENGRLQILNIHTATMKKSGRLSEDIDLREIAALSKNYTGAELAGVVRAASSFAFNRAVKPSDLSHPQDSSNLKTTREDFLLGLEEVKPKFGVSDSDFSACIANGIIQYGESFSELTDAATLLIQQVKNSSRTPLVSLLLEGPVGCGKTAVAASLALKGEFHFVKLITPDNCIGFSETAKCSYINQVFEDAYKSANSCVVIDDIERLLDYTPIGPRFSNVVLQALLVLTKKVPPKGRRLFIVGTTSCVQVLTDMGFTSIFSSVLTVPCVAPGQEVYNVLSCLDVFSEQELQQISKACLEKIPIKKLLSIAEMAQQGADKGVARFLKCMKDYGILSAASASSPYSNY